jgi:hypothetical protein
MQNADTTSETPRGGGCSAFGGLWHELSGTVLVLYHAVYDTYRNDTRHNCLKRVLNFGKDKRDDTDAESIIGYSREEQDSRTFEGTSYHDAVLGHRQTEFSSFHPIALQQTYRPMGSSVE